jgi:hypothetical protein
MKRTIILVTALAVLIIPATASAATPRAGHSCGNWQGGTVTMQYDTVCSFARRMLALGRQATSFETQNPQVEWTSSYRMLTEPQDCDGLKQIEPVSSPPEDYGWIRWTQTQGCPTIPLGDAILPGYEQVKPGAITTTGDGSAYFGGRTGHAVSNEGRQRPDFGHLAWTRYTQTEADATGVEWIKVFGRTSSWFHIDGTVKLHFSDLVNGVFTRLTVDERYGHDVVPLPKRVAGKHETYHFTYSTN